MRMVASIVLLLVLGLGGGAPALFAAVEDCDDDASHESDCCTPADGCLCCLHPLHALEGGPGTGLRPDTADFLEAVSVVPDLALLPDDVLHVPRSRL